jgi:acylphosphatase
MAVQAKRVSVSGRVQGVGFRFFVQRIARGLGLTGNVRNRFDSTVEIIVEGEEEVLAEFLRGVAKGPPLSRVDRVDVADLVPGGRYRDFLIEGW